MADVYLTKKGAVADHSTPYGAAQAPVGIQTALQQFNAVEDKDQLKRRKNDEASFHGRGFRWREMVMSAFASTVLKMCELSDDGRRFLHNCRDDGPLTANELALPSDVKKQILDFVVSTSAEIYRCFGPKDALKNGDFSLYTGAAGIWFMLERLIQLSSTTIPELAQVAPGWSKQQKEYLNALDALSDTNELKRSAKERFTFHEGLSGMNSILSFESHRAGDQKGTEKFLHRVARQLDIALDDSSDEILYGRAGYLLSLLFLSKHLPADVSKHVKNTVEEMIDSGHELGGPSCPLFYKWHNKSYLGSAHGLSGILQVLLMCNPAVWKPHSDDIEKSIDRVCSVVEYHKGAMPSSLESGNLGYCQWCHGSPAAVFLLVEAIKHFPNNKDRYLATARSAAEDVWQHGLLVKGPGLCHGLSGNAYAFLSMYRLTGEIKYWNRAYKFFAAYLDPNIRSKLNRPDTPFSLYEGVAGLVLLAADLLAPAQSGFPGFEIL